MSAPKPTEWKKFEYKAPGISITGGTKRGKNKATTGTATKSGTSKKPAASLPTPATTTSSHSLEKTDLEKVVSGWLNGLNDNDDKPDESTSGLCETIAQIGGKFKASETTLEKKENKSKTTISQPLHKNATAFSGKPSPKRAKLNGSARNDSQRGFSQTGSAVEIISDGSEDSDGEVLHSIRPPSVPGPRYQEPPKAQRRTTVPRKKPSTKAKLSIVDVDALPDSNTPQPKTKSSNSKEISPIHSPGLLSDEDSQGFGEAVLAFYERDSLYYPARIVRSKRADKLSTVEFVNGETASLAKIHYYTRHEHRFNMVPMGKLPMAKPGDSRSVEERRQEQRAALSREPIPDIRPKLKAMLSYINEIFDGDHPNLWRHKDFLRQTAGASRRLLNGTVQAYFTDEEYQKIGDYILKKVRKMEHDSMSDVQRRKMSLDVLVPEAAIRLIMDHHGLEHDEAEHLFLTGGDRPNAGGKLGEIAEEWVRSLLAWRTDFAFS